MTTPTETIELVSRALAKLIDSYLEAANEKESDGEGCGMCDEIAHIYSNIANDLIAIVGPNWINYRESEETP